MYHSDESYSKHIDKIDEVKVMSEELYALQKHVI